MTAEKLSDQDRFLVMYAAGLRAREYILNGKEGDAYQCLRDAMRRCDRAEPAGDEEDIDYKKLCLVLEEAFHTVREALAEEDWERATGAMMRGDRLYFELCDELAARKTAKKAASS